MQKVVTKSHLSFCHPYHKFQFYDQSLINSLQRIIRIWSLTHTHIVETSSWKYPGLLWCTETIINKSSITSWRELRDVENNYYWMLCRMFSWVWMYLKYTKKFKSLMKAVQAMFVSEHQLRVWAGMSWDEEEAVNTAETHKHWHQHCQVSTQLLQCRNQ